jgi:murein DD-endopeptidase MepM/ murein hydrolase activator NlpD
VTSLLVAGAVPAAATQAAGATYEAPTRPTVPAPGPGPDARHSAGRAAPGITYRPPIQTGARVINPFRAPAHRYGPGHRGVDLQLSLGGAVLAAGPGTVRFAGPVAGRGVVVLTHPDGLITEYEPVTPLVTVGTAVSAGQPIARLAGVHPRCAVSCLHWAARRGEDYLDPMALLGALGPVRLMPLG